MKKYVDAYLLHNEKRVPVSILIVLTLSGYVCVYGEHIFMMCFDNDIHISEERNGQEYETMKRD